MENKGYERNNAPVYPKLETQNNAIGSNMPTDSPSQVNQSPKNRDPNDLNRHIQVKFDDIVGEPDGVHSPQFFYNCSFLIYKYTQKYLYIVLVILISPFIAVALGLLFAVLSFIHVWILGPIVRVSKITFAFIRKIIMIYLYSVVSPMIEVLAVLFSKVKVRYQKIPDGNVQESKDAEYFNV